MGTCLPLWPSLDGGGNEGMYEREMNISGRRDVAADSCSPRDAELHCLWAMGAKRSLIVSCRGRGNAGEIAGPHTLDAMPEPTQAGSSCTTQCENSTRIVFGLT